MREDGNSCRITRSRRCSRRARLTAARPLDDDQIQPASLDLGSARRPGACAPASCPGRGHRVAEKLDRLKLHEIDLADGAVLETGCVYIVPLLESLDLPADDLGLGQSEKLDRPARHLHPRHDRPRPGVRQDPGRLCRPALSRGQPAHLPDRRRAPARACRRSASAPAMRCCRRARAAGAARHRDAGRLRDAQHFRRRHRAVDRPDGRRRTG